MPRSIPAWSGATLSDAFLEFFDLPDALDEVALIAIALGLLAALIRPLQVIYRRNGTGAIAGFDRVGGRTWSGDRLRDRHTRLYDWIAGVHPERRIWHSQWLSVKDLYHDLRRILPTLRGNVLDVGCYGKPYAKWLTGVQSHIGLDVAPGETVDHVIRDGERWPLESNAFQSVLCTQVLQVVRDLPHLISEIDRVLEVGGIAVVTTPFFYNDMSIEQGRGIYKDYWRHSFYGAQEIFLERFEILDVRAQGGFGSTAGVMLLNWLHKSMARNSISEFLMIALLPLWLLLCVAVNTTGWLFDKLDGTGAFYHNVLLVLRKK
jgi:SAM-dependent methyltransferase